MLTMILFSVAIALQRAIVIALVRKYLRTRDAGFIWLGVAVVLWPRVSGLLDHGKHNLFVHISRGQLAGFYPFSLIER